MKSKLPDAEKFQDWVHDEVLPQIRKAGSYSLPTDPHDQVLMLCERLSAMATEAKQLTQKIAEKEKTLIIQAPKVALADQFISDSDFCLSIADIAQSIYINDKLIGRNRLMRLMKADEIIYEDHARKNHVYQGYTKYFKAVPGKNNDHSFNAIKSNAKGSLFLIGKYNNKKVI
jgi:anti-repressor protein